MKQEHKRNTNQGTETMIYKITATTPDSNGTRVHCDSDYALGQYARMTWSMIDDAEKIADELREDVGDVVDESVEYEISEAD